MQKSKDFLEQKGLLLKVIETHQLLAKSLLEAGKADKPPPLDAEFLKKINDHREELKKRRLEKLAAKVDAVPVEDKVEEKPVEDKVEEKPVEDKVDELAEGNVDEPAGKVEEPVEGKVDEPVEGKVEEPVKGKIENFGKLLRQG